MKKNLVISLALLAAPLFAEHVYPDNPDPTNTAFFGQLNRDSRVVTNTPPIVETDPTVYPWAKEYSPFAPTNTAEAAGKAADAKLTGIALTNRYTKAETDEFLKDVARFGKKNIGLVAEIGNDGRIVSGAIANNDTHYGFGLPINVDVIGGGEVSVIDKAGVTHRLTKKANRAGSGDADEIATLDEDGNPTRSGIAADDVITKESADATLVRTNGINEVAFYDSFELRGGSFALFRDDERSGNIHLRVDVITGLAELQIYEFYQISDSHGNDIQSEFDAKADRTMISATNETFAAEVLAVQVSSLSTNITAEVYIAATNACANLGIDQSLIPQGGTLGTVGGLLVALAAAVALLRKKTKLLKSDGTAEDDFATQLLEKSVAKTALMIPLEAKTDSFTAEDGHAYSVTMTGTVTITMPTATTGKAAIFQARFSAAAQQSVEFSTTALVKFDGTDCGIVKAGKDAILSAMWNGEAWDLVWKNQA